MPSSAKSLIVDSMFLQISFTYARNSRGPNTLPCGTADVALTSSDSCPPTLTLWVRPKRNSLVHITTLESTPDAAIFVSSRSCGTKSKAFEKSIYNSVYPTSIIQWVRMSWQTLDYLIFTWISRPEFMLPHRITNGFFSRFSSVMMR
jgi:hypothetical protein